MKVSYNWLQDYFDTKLPSPKEIGDKLTFHAFEIESVEEVGAHFNNVVIGKVLKKEKHPNADRLNVCVVDVGDGGRTIVCGAANVAEGQTVAVALPGAVLPGDFAIKISKIRGIESNGMICSERELAFTKEAEGIWVIEKEVKVGTPLKEFLGIETDYVFDIKVLPDRAHDCLSHQGIAREISALFSISLKTQNFSKDFPKGNKLNISIEKDVCKRYMGAAIRNVKVGQSPDWLQARLRVLGQRPINTVVDITNYVMLDTGQPLHAFDLSKITEKKGVYSIGVNQIKKQEKFKALDGVEYELSIGAIAIVDGSSGKTLGIAGIKGGDASAVGPETTDILLESAQFDPVATRVTSQSLKLRTESSSRFEKDVSPELALHGFLRALSLIQELGVGEVAEVCDVYPDPQQKKVITFSLADVHDVLGVNIAEQDIVRILNGLDFTVSIEKGKLRVEVPHVRLDVEIKEHVIEEIGRVYGYDHVHPKNLPSQAGSISIDPLYFYSSRIRHLLSAQGFSEIQTYSFRDEGDVEVMVPLAKDKGYLRKDLMSGMLESMKVNEYNAPLLGLDQVKVFEIGTVFNKDGEHVSLCIGIKNVKGYKKIKEESVFIKVQELLKKELGIEFFLKGFKAGFFEINLEEVIKGLPQPQEYVFEKELAVSLYKPISAYPFMLRDIAVLVPEEATEKEVANLIRNNAGNLLVRQTLFDVFKKDGKVSYAFRLVFESQEKTLTDEEIHKVMEKIVGEVSKKGWTVR